MPEIKIKRGSLFPSELCFFRGVGKGLCVGGCVVILWWG